jgi:predicted DNA-binding transcriptional regulator YafY
LAVWEVQRRLDFIDANLAREKPLRKKDLMDYFGISVAQASKDIVAYQKAGGKLTYNKKSKSYMPSRAFKPLYDGSPKAKLKAFDRLGKYVE